MSAFLEQLQARKVRQKNRRWVFVPYDQLSDKFGPLSREKPDQLGIVLVESLWKASLRPYHKQKLALVLSNLRHFALEQAERGVAVRHVVTGRPYAAALRPVARELGSLSVMRPAERELRADLEPLVNEGLLEILPHEGWLTSPEDFVRSQERPPWRMDAFYRQVRRRTGVLMEAGKPLGGKFSFDPENRRSWKGDPPAPRPPRFRMDEVKEEVARLVAEEFARHPGKLDPRLIPATRRDARRQWRWAREDCLPQFGPFEDAMSVHSQGLFHTRISALLHLHRLLPAEVIEETEEMEIPLPSKEGFIRQVLGWREFMRHVHEVTDGFRNPPTKGIGRAREPGDAGYGKWIGKPWRSNRRRVSNSDRKESSLDGGAKPRAVKASLDLPAVFWGDSSGLHCVDRVIGEVWDTGYGHHITRLMVLSNFASLIGVSPRQLTDWFWIAYSDAYDWVVEPNVLGMGTFALGGLFTTKPYISGAAYINRMSDYCGACRFDPKSTCPFTSLYWAYLERHRAALESNPRLRMPLRTLQRRAAPRKQEDAKVYARVRRVLKKGAQLEPES